jgi:non-canonical (house-cleaning) NTP pyrophosphatase
VGKSRTGTFAIPPAVTELVRSGKELGEADDIVFGETNSKHSSGAIGILTHGILDRASYYAEAVLMALIPFKNASLYLLQEEV